MLLTPLVGGGFLEPGPRIGAYHTRALNEGPMGPSWGAWKYFTAKLRARSKSCFPPWFDEESLGLFRIYYEFTMVLLAFY